METNKTLSAEQIEALQDYAASHGRTWKQQLRDEWMNATTIGTVHALRNAANFGPSGLIRFNLKAGKVR